METALTSSSSNKRPHEETEKTHEEPHEPSGSEIKSYFLETYPDLSENLPDGIFAVERSNRTGTFNFSAFDDDKTNLIDIKYAILKQKQYRFLIQGKRLNYFKCNYLELFLYYVLGGPKITESHDQNIYFANKIVNISKEYAEDPENAKNSESSTVSNEPEPPILGETVGISLLRKLNYIFEKVKDIPGTKRVKEGTVPNYDEIRTGKIIGYLKRKCLNQLVDTKTVKLHNGLNLNIDPDDYYFSRIISWEALRPGDTIYYHNQIVGSIEEISPGNVRCQEVINQTGSARTGTDEQSKRPELV